MPPARQDVAPSRESPAAESQSRPVPREAAPELAEDDDELEPKSSGFVVFLKVILLLSLLTVAGLMVWSLIETNDPNPLPFLRERFGLPF